MSKNRSYAGVRVVKKYEERVPIEIPISMRRAMEVYGIDFG